MRVIATAIPLLLLCRLALAAPATWNGKVVAVADGDTITVLHDGVGVKIRLQGVDAPEKAQPFGDRATQLTSSLVLNQEVRVQSVARDRYGRTLARVSYLGKLGFLADATPQATVSFFAVETDDQLGMPPQNLQPAPFGCTSCEDYVKLDGTAGQYLQREPGHRLRRGHRLHRGGLTAVARRHQRDDRGWIRHRSRGQPGTVARRRRAVRSRLDAARGSTHGPVARRGRGPDRLRRGRGQRRHRRGR